MQFDDIIIIPIMIGNYFCWKNVVKKNLNKTLSICIWLVFIFWYTLPGLCYLLIKNNEIINLSLFYSNLEKNEFANCFLIETLSVITVFIFLNNIKPLKIERKANNDFEKDIFPNTILIIYSIIILIITILLLSKSDRSYLEINSGENYGNSSVFVKLINEFEVVFKSFIVCFILKTNKNEKNEKYYFFLFLGSILPFYVGNRASILLILLVFVIKLFSSELSSLEIKKEIKN